MNTRSPIHDHDDLREQLLELHYGLLEAPDAERLREQIASDATTAALWAETLATSEKFKLACRSEDTPPAFAISSVQTDAQEPCVAPEKPRPFWQTPTVIAALAACCGFVLLAIDYRKRIPAKPLASLQVRAANLVSPSADQPARFRVTTAKIDGAADLDTLRKKQASAQSELRTSAALAFRVMTQGTVLYAGKATTDTAGTADITLPDQLMVPPNAELEIKAHSIQGEARPAKVSLPLPPTRCLTYLSVDRPVIRPGETVFFRSLTLSRRSFVPSADIPIRFELLDPSGTLVPGALLEGVTSRGVGNGAFVIPAAAPGGPYTLIARSLDECFPEERHTFEVRQYRLPRFQKKIELDQRSYGPGEQVAAELIVRRAEGEALADATVNVTVKVDGETIEQSSMTTSLAGRAVATFALPEFIDVGEAEVSMAIDDGGTREAISKTIPIELGRIDVEFYPEGGPLVAGLPNRVYFVARNTMGEPVSCRGEIQDSLGKRIVEVATVRDGMGRFEFTPQAGQHYVLKILSPMDIQNVPELPGLVEDVPVLQSFDDVIEAGQPIKLQLHSSIPRDVEVRTVCRGSLAGRQQKSLQAGINTLSIPLEASVQGVLRLTVLDLRTVPATPLVERLVYRRPHSELQVEVRQGSQREHLEASPGESVRLHLRVQDESGRSVPATLGLAVVDQASLSLKTTEQPTAETHFWLTSEIRSPADLEHADFYLKETDEAAQSLDLLLGTQGWRRFAEGPAAAGVLDQANESYREELSRLLQLDGNEVVVSGSLAKTSTGYLREWYRYFETQSKAWHQLLNALRVWLFLVWLGWLFWILARLRLRRRRRDLYFDQLTAGVLLCLGVSSIAIYGCGGAQPTASIDAVRSDREATGMAGPAESPNLSMPSDAFAGGESPDSMIDRMSAAVSQFADQVSSRLSGQATDAAVDLLEQRQPITAEQLKRLLAARGMDISTLAKQLIDELRFPVRQYAHRNRRDHDAIRSDFAETLLWQPLVVTDSDGTAAARFDLSDSVTSFQVLVTAHTPDGRLCTHQATVVSRLPFQVEPTLPLEVTTGDRIDLPVAVNNATDMRQEIAIAIKTDDALSVQGDHSVNKTMQPATRTRTLFPLNVTGKTTASSTVEVQATSGRHQDAVRRTVRVVPAGYPVRKSVTSKLTDNARVQLPIAGDFIPGSLEVTLRAFPSPMADVISGVDSILREPHGCFEQASATNYPNAMALLYMRENKLTQPSVKRRSMGLLERGYQKLTSYECSKLGYEWFGSDPGHEALSAFGLMQFTDMSQLMPVDQAMLQRTRRWLLDRRDQQGGFLRNPRHLHVWSVKQEVVNAYILWAISEADLAAGKTEQTRADLADQLDRLKTLASQSEDAYLIALSAATLMNVGQSADGEVLLNRLAMLQDQEGQLQGVTTITSSGGLSRSMETTALAVIAWMKHPGYRPQARLAANWITRHRTVGGGFGSTQATVLALKALLAVSSDVSIPAGGSELTLHLGEHHLATVTIPADSVSGEPIELTGLGPDIEALLGDLPAADRAETVQLELSAPGVQNLTCIVDCVFNQVQPASDTLCPLKLATRWHSTDSENRDDKSQTLDAGKTADITIELSNPTDQGLPMTVAIVGLPGGVSPRIERLDELKAAGQIDYYEIRGRELAFYWRSILPKSECVFSFSVTADIPGQYTGPASRAYLYYTAEQKTWESPLQTTIEMDK